MIRRFRYLYAGLAAVCLVAGAIAWWVVIPGERAIRVGTGVVGHTLCSGVFVSGLDPDQLFAEALLPNPGLKQLSKRLRYEIDRGHHQVTVTWAGRFQSRAVYRDGFGCRIEFGPPHSGRSTEAGELLRDQPAAVGSPPDTLVPAGAQPGADKLAAALDRAFAEPSQPPFRWVKAIVILHRGQLIAERYAPGYSTSTPIYGYSVTKSVINALVGILVRQGKLSVAQLAPVPEWRNPSDPRHAITIDQLLRMTSGLDLEESDSGFDPVSRMLFLEPDMAGFAARARLRAAPGTTWSYTSGNTLILSRVIRDAVGGHAEDVVEFARRELFEPLGITTATLEFDHAGTPVGSQGMLASARDWARFGLLYQNDGMAGQRRILPEHWVDYSTTPTARSDYGAGFWTNRGANEDAQWRVRSGMPADSFYASGNFGQRIVIAPSAGLVIVRMGWTHSPGFDMKGLVRLVKDATSIVAGE